MYVPMFQIAVIGAGIAGLAAASRLREAGLEVTLFEASSRPGGVIETEQSGGFLVDYGPNTLMPRPPELERIIGALGIESERVWADASAAKRYIVRDGKPVAAPSSPAGFFSTRLLSAGARLRILKEPLIRKADAQEDESLAEFVRRRLGPEVLDYAVNPFVAGVFAGDPERLAVRHAFPRLHAFEREHGSLLRGGLHAMRAARKQRIGPRVRPRPFSFRNGMKTLTDALAATLGDSLRLDSPVQSISESVSGWRLSLQDGEEHEFSAVVVTAPLHRLPEMGMDVSALSRVEYPPVSVLALGFRREEVEHPLDGFGVLVPEKEPFSILGCLFSSSMFDGRAPAGHVLLTCFVGGSRAPELARQPADRLTAIALGDLRRLLGVRGEPVFRRHRFWERAIPQYTLGYGTVLERLAEIEHDMPGLHFAGNYRRGISTGEALASGREAAERLLAVLS
jgi:protoporphyrinogen/coproporphyrinogen III oxidase